MRVANDQQFARGQAPLVLGSTIILLYPNIGKQQLLNLFEQQT